MKRADDLKIAWARERDDAWREELSAQMEESAVAYERACRMYAQSTDERAECKARMKAVYTLFRRLPTQQGQAAISVFPSPEPTPRKLDRKKSATSRQNSRC
jgi:hypothetical protein